MGGSYTDGICWPREARLIHSHIARGKRLISTLGIGHGDILAGTPVRLSPNAVKKTPREWMPRPKVTESSYARKRPKSAGLVIDRNKHLS